MKMRRMFLYIAFIMLILFIVIGPDWLSPSRPPQLIVHFPPVPSYPNATASKTELREQGAVQITTFDTNDAPTVVCAFYDKTLRGLAGWQYFEGFRYFHKDAAHPDSLMDVMATRIS